MLDVYGHAYIVLVIVKNIITVFMVLLSLGTAVPDAQGITREELQEQFEAWLEWLQERDRENSGNGGVEGDSVESAAVAISDAISSEAGADSDRYLDYSKRLAMTLNQKSKAELQRVLASNDTLGLGN